MYALGRSRAHAIALRSSSLHPLGVIESIVHKRGQGN